MSNHHGPVFALNHMATPSLDWLSFLDLARTLGCAGVEFRNDLAAPLFDGAEPATVKSAVAARGLRFLALAEVKKFNDWSDAKRAEAETLMQIAVAAGAEAVSLIPRNDGVSTGEVERRAAMTTALRECLPMLRAHGLKAMVEPLGFEVCSLRSKSELVDVIESLGGRGTCFVVHDTFHHHLAGGGPIFPDHTGIVHVSGVVDTTVSVADMRDGHRVLVDAQDRLGNLAQITALREAGYRGPISFEPFAASVHTLADPATALRRSMDFIRSGLEV